MTPNVAGKGESFKGAGLYYLHDKGAATSERVAFTHTENLPTDDPGLALRLMAHTAMSQARLKAAAGIKNTGRKVVGPVYTYSLAWHPEQAPTREHMVEAARASMKYLGFEGHEAVFVAHNDTAHPHIHVILNRINPENGIVKNPYKDYLAFSKWAEKYQKERGENYCPQRPVNNAQRAQGQFVRYRPQAAAAQIHRWRKDQVRAAFAARQDAAGKLSASHRQQRQALYDDKEERIRQLRQEQRERYRRYWAVLYQHQEAQRAKLQMAQAAPSARLSEWLRDRKADRWGDDRHGRLAAAFNAGEALHRQRPALAAKQEAERAKLAGRIGERTRPEIHAINREYQDGLARLKEAQAKEARTLRRRHSAESQRRARAIASGADEREFKEATGQTATAEFAKAAGQTPPGERASTEETNRTVLEWVKQARKREKEERKRGKDTGREREP